MGTHIENESFLSELFHKLDKYFDFNDLKTLCFELNIDFESISLNDGKQAFLRDLLIRLSRDKDSLEKFFNLASSKRENMMLPDFPENFELHLISFENSNFGRSNSLDSNPVTSENWEQKNEFHREVNISNGGAIIGKGNVFNINIRSTRLVIGILLISILLFLGYLVYFLRLDLNIKISEIGGILKPLNTYEYKENQDTMEIVFLIPLIYENQGATPLFIEEIESKLIINDEEFILEAHKYFGKEDISNFLTCGDFSAFISDGACSGSLDFRRSISDSENASFVIAFKSQTLTWSTFSKLVSNEDTQSFLLSLNSRVDQNFRESIINTECIIELEDIRDQQFRYQNDSVIRGLSFICQNNS